MNLTKKFVINGFVALGIIIFSMIILLTLNFNMGFDFTGGTIIKINITSFTEKEAETKIENTMNSFDIYNYSIISGENSSDANGTGETVLTVKYQENSSSPDDSSIRNSLLQNFGYDGTNEVESKYVSIVSNLQPAYDNLVFLNAFLSVLVMGVACAVYMFARHKLSSAVILLAQLLLDIGLMLSAVLILRLEITSLVGIVIIGTAIYSIASTLLNVSNFNKIAKEEKNQKLSNAEIVRIGTKTKTNLVFAIVSIISLLIIMLFSGIKVVSFIIAFGLGIATTYYTSTVFLPFLWESSHKRATNIARVKQKINSIEVNKEE